MKTMLDYQREVGQWAVSCFGIERANDPRERNLRFLEESIELVQANGLSHEEALAVLDYVYSRPRGSVAQEVGGAIVTLAALCRAAGISLDDAATTELSRISERVVEIREKNLKKPLGWKPIYKPQ